MHASRCPHGQGFVASRWCALDVAAADSWFVSCAHLDVVRLPREGATVLGCACKVVGARASNDEVAVDPDLDWGEAEEVRDVPIAPISACRRFWSPVVAYVPFCEDDTRHAV